MLDVAQDYALKHLHDQGAFELGIVLKGGTSLRKLRAGNAGPFSTDLDFATPDLETAEFLLDTLDGAGLFDVRFSLAEREATRAKLIVDTGQATLQQLPNERFPRRMRRGRGRTCAASWDGHMWPSRQGHMWPCHRTVHARSGRPVHIPVGPAPHAALAIRSL